MTTQEEINWKKTIEWLKSSYGNIHLHYNSVEGWARLSYKHKQATIYHYFTRNQILEVIDDFLKMKETISI